MSLTAAALLNHQIETLPRVDWLTIHPGSLAFIVLPTLVVAMTFGPRLGWRGAIALMIGAGVTISVIELGAGRWFNNVVFSSSVFRIFAALAPIAAASIFMRLHSEEEGQVWRFLAGGIVLGFFISIMLPTSQVRSIVFDEAHGKWETTQAPFGPDDFGRAVYYTYSLLFSYAERVVGTARVFEREAAPLPDQDALFVLKMPIQPLSDAFADRLETWVRSGGRLMVVADHTDLYDTTQHLNAFLSPRFGLKINPDAVFNHTGMPTVPITERSAALFGQIVAHGRPFPWQTGTSLSTMPVNTVSLATFGPSFSEPGDYSRQNRFGSFAPGVSLRFASHIAVAAFGINRGAIAVVLDSTPWSNFSFFREQYRHLFRSVIHALERPAALQLWGWSSLALAVLAIVCVIFRRPATFAAGGLTLGLAIGAASQIGVASFSVPVEGRDFGLRVAVGSTARLEFLNQLVGPGERNFARIISAMAKYAFDPVSSTPGSALPDLTTAKRWLLIQPDSRQLPNFEALKAHLQHGGDLTVLFAPDQAADPEVRNWLASFGLATLKTVGLAVAEDARPGLLNRKGAALLRDTRVMTRALPISLLKDRETSPLIQSYTMRPTTLPRTSGLLNIGFSADQFSDDAVGDVWEGIHPASLGRLRERQLGEVLAGNDLPAPFPDGLVAPSTSSGFGNFLPVFVLMENGKPILSGKFDDLAPVGSKPFSASENPIGYLASLRQRAIAFIETECPRTSKTTQCSKRLLGPDAIEWMVTWAADDNGRMNAVELLHERRFSGLGSTLNVIFGK
jgi:hypothetical protein